MGLAELARPGLLVIAVFIASSLYVHFRGKERYHLSRQLMGLSALIAPYNVFAYLFSAVPNRPILDPRDFPELELLRANWETIRDEAKTLLEHGHVRAADSYNDAGFNSFYRRGWRRFVLSWYGGFLPSARELCPKTVSLLEQTPSIHAAMIVLLAPGKRLNRHRDPFAGSLRFHLGLITPNSERCRIYIDGEPYHWRDGHDIVFDETYVHRAVNQSDEARIILFADVERPLRGRIPTAINRFVIRHLVKATAMRNNETEQVGLINRAFEYVYRGRLVAKVLKVRSRFSYYAIKYALIGALVAVLLLLL